METDFKLTREEAMRRFMEAKRRKQEFVSQAIEIAKENFRKEHGEYPVYVEVW